MSSKFKIAKPKTREQCNKKGNLDTKEQKMTGAKNDGMMLLAESAWKERVMLK